MTKTETPKQQRTTRRWVAPNNLMLQIFEPHKEERDPLTKSVTGYARANGEIVQRSELKVLRFQPSSVLWPPRATHYVNKLVGAIETNDPAEIALLEWHERNPKGGAKIEEYPREWEMETRTDPRAREDKGLYVEE